MKTKVVWKGVYIFPHSQGFSSCKISIQIQKFQKKWNNIFVSFFCKFIINEKKWPVCAFWRICFSIFFLKIHCTMRITFMMKKKYHNYWNEHGEYLLNQWILLCLLRNSEMCEYYKIKCRREQVFFLLGTVSKSNSIFSNRIFFLNPRWFWGRLFSRGSCLGGRVDPTPVLKEIPVRNLLRCLSGGPRLGGRGWRRGWRGFQPGPDFGVRLRLHAVMCATRCSDPCVQWAPFGPIFFPFWKCDVG